jgi:outer membrane receptor protein involved in Fe transport
MIDDSLFWRIVIEFSPANRDDIGSNLTQGEDEMARYSSVSMLAIAAALAVGGQAWAQDDATAVGEVVVTAQKRNESLLETPQTVNVVSGASLRILPGSHLASTSPAATDGSKPCRCGE